LRWWLSCSRLRWWSGSFQPNQLTTTSPDTAPSMAAPTTIPVPTSTVYAKPTRNPAPTVQIGFETGLAGWRPIGAARIQRDPLAREGRWVARFNGTGVADQGLALPAVLRCKLGKSYDHRTHWSGPDPQRSPPTPTTVKSSSPTGRSPCGSASVPP
jgi:hypothetical protein